MENKLMGDLSERLTVDESDPEKAWLVAFEPTAESSPCYIETDIDLDPELEQEVDYSKSIIIKHPVGNTSLPETLSVTGWDGESIPAVVISARRDTYMHRRLETAPEIYRVNRARVALLLPHGGFGFSGLRVARSDEQQTGFSRDQHNHIENDFIRLEANSQTGDFTLINKASGRKLTGIHRLTDCGDAGDEYTYSWPERDRKVEWANCRISREIVGSLAQKLILTGEMRLPESLTEDRKARSERTVPCQTSVTALLVSGSRYVEFRTEFLNNARDHRLRVEYPCGVLTNQSQSLGAFTISSRDIEVPVPEHWMEYPENSHPNHGLAYAGTDEGGLSVFTKGLTEYAAENTGGQTILQVTLLRCVGWLSRDDLQARKGNGGWTFETPGAQCPGLHVFETAVMPHEGDPVNGGAVTACDRYLNPVRLHQTRWGKSAPPRNPFPLRLPWEVRLSACKKPHDGEGLVLRLYNIARKDVSLTLPSLDGYTAYKTNLAEKPEHLLPACCNGIPVTLKGAEVFTVLYKKTV